MNYTIIAPSKPRVVFEEKNKGVYEIDSLYAGYGHTLGNSLRRIILSSIAGAAITAIKIEGVPHEFSKISGVKEDVITIILNLKRIRFKLNSDEPQIAKISVSGAKNITAKDIDTPTQIEVLNTKEHIATLTSKDAKLNIELTIEKGLGYVPRESLRKDKVDVGVIVLDAVFTPIKRVNYEVENMRVGDRTDYNRLRFSIETDGSISPSDALEGSIKIMINHLRAITGFQEEIESGEKELKKTKEGLEDKGELLGKSQEKKVKLEADKTEDKEILKTRVEDLKLSAKTLNILSDAGIRTIGGLARKRESDLLDMEGIGKKMVQEIRKALSDYGLILK
ncbi:MAG: DNA-directed RNA polymerase subunit alpha [Patescibacteria group bacterium]